MLSKINPTQTNSWKALDEHFGGNDFDLRSLFHYNPNRFNEFSLQKDNYLFDYSKNLIDSRTKDLLLQLAEESQLKDAISKMFSGDKINETEGRAVLHTALRDFSDKEISKLQRFITMANDMILLIEQHVSVKDPIIFGFEGVSYGSGGGGTNNLIDLAAAAAIFKYCLLQKFKNPKTNIVTVAPTTIKKHAGNGRLKKRELWDVFVNNNLDDSLLIQNSVWDFARNLEIGAKVPKPFDDLIDAYFLASYLRAL